jgi:hypothetical protein
METATEAVLTRQSGISNPHQSGPRMKGAKSDWRVNGGMRPGRKTTERNRES